MRLPPLRSWARSSGPIRPIVRTAPISWSPSRRMAKWRSCTAASWTLRARSRLSMPRSRCGRRRRMDCMSSRMKIRWSLICAASSRRMPRAAITFIVCGRRRILFLMTVCSFGFGVMLYGVLGLISWFFRSCGQDASDDGSPSFPACSHPYHCEFFSPLVLLVKD